MSRFSKTLLFAAFAACSLVAVTSSASANPTPAGQARVIVSLNVPASNDPAAAISQTTDQLLASLPVGDYTVSNRFSTIPMVTLSVGPSAQAALAGSPYVAAVEADTSVKRKAATRKCKVYKIGDGSKGVKICKKSKKAAR